MHSRVRVLSAVILIWGGASDAGAGTVTYTGAQLQTVPGVTFPNDSVTVNGSSLAFASRTAGFPKLVTVPVAPAGALSFGSVVTITATLTRLGCDQYAPDVCSTVGDGDFDPHLLLGDGKVLVGAVVSDPNGTLSTVSLEDAGALAANRLGGPFFTATQPFPAIGGSFSVTGSFTLNAGSTPLFGSLLGNSATNLPDRSLDPSLALFFALVRDNDTGERYQLDSISITTPLAAVPLPGALALLAGALGPLALGLRRLRTSSMAV